MRDPIMPIDGLKGINPENPIKLEIENSTFGISSKDTMQANDLLDDILRWLTGLPAHPTNCGSACGLGSGQLEIEDIIL